MSEQSKQAKREAAVAEAALRPFVEQMRLLDEALYGTLVPRDPAEGSGRFKRVQDGWRHGQPHPFTYEGETYDVRTPADPGRANDENVAQHTTLRGRIEAAAQVALDAALAAVRT